MKVRSFRGPPASAPLTPEQCRARALEVATALAHGDPQWAQVLRATALFTVALVGTHALPGYADHRGAHLHRSELP